MPLNSKKKLDDVSFLFQTSMTYIFLKKTFKMLERSVRLPRWFNGKEAACQCRRHKRCGFNPWVGKIPYKGKWQPTPVFLSGKSHGWRSLAGCSP